MSSMKRKRFITLMSVTALHFSFSGFENIKLPEPEKFYFKDDGKIPNSKLPLLLYRNVFTGKDDEGALWLEQRFASNNWINSWRNGIYSFHHYHSTSHEVLGVYSGKALVHLGGERGSKVEIAAGDIIIIPAGVGHKNLSSTGLGVVGAYPEGCSWDMNKGLTGERPLADQNIAALPIPRTDPLLGKNAGLIKLWS
jgi:uncharacterized protein YjlB